MKAAQVEMRQGVVLPQEDWDSLAGEDGRVVARSTGDIVFVPVAEDPSGDMSIGTADVTLTFTRSDGSGNETSYDETRAGERSGAVRSGVGADSGHGAARR